MANICGTRTTEKCYYSGILSNVFLCLNRGQRRFGNEFSRHRRRVDREVVRQLENAALVVGSAPPVVFVALRARGSPVTDRFDDGCTTIVTPSTSPTPHEKKKTLQSPRLEKN